MPAIVKLPAFDSTKRQPDVPNNARVVTRYVLQERILVTLRFNRKGTRAYLSASLYAEAGDWDKHILSRPMALRASNTVSTSNTTLMKQWSEAIRAGAIEIEKG